MQRAPASGRRGQTQRGCCTSQHRIEPASRKELGLHREEKEEEKNDEEGDHSTTWCNAKGRGTLSLSPGRQHVAERCWLEKSEPDKVESRGMYR